MVGQYMERKRAHAPGAQAATHETMDHSRIPDPSGRRQLQARKYWVSDVGIRTVDDRACILGSPHSFHHHSNDWKLRTHLGSEAGLPKQV